MRYIFSIYIIIMLLPYMISSSEVNREKNEQDKPIRSSADLKGIEQRVSKEYKEVKMLSLGILDVTKPPYEADPSGYQDSTIAIQRAIRDARDARLVTYLPAGDYLISDTLVGVQGVVKDAPFQHHCSIEGPRFGQRAKLVLKNKAVGFGDRNYPKPVIRFWARSLTDSPYSAYNDPTKSQPNINFYQTIRDIDIDLGQENFGAVGIEHQSAQGSVIEDVKIFARDGFSGIYGAPGSGGGSHGLTVIGGRYGLYLPRRTTQPAPVFSNLTLKGQYKAAIICHSNGPMTIVGANIEGSGIKSQGPTKTNVGDGALCLVDATLILNKPDTAIRADKSLVLNNVWIKNAKTAVDVRGNPKVAGNIDGWVHVSEYAATTKRKSINDWDIGTQRDTLFIEHLPTQSPITIVDYEATEPTLNFSDRHTWPHPFPSYLSAGSVNVRDAPYHAAGDGKTDDTAALQHAIDENEIVFLPKGDFRISSPLHLGPKTKFIGVNSALSIIGLHDNADAWADPDYARPLIDTVDDAQAETVLAFIGISVPVRFPAAYALRWRAGRRSIVRDIRPVQTGWTPFSPVACEPQILVTGHGGGLWYTLNLYHSAPHAQGPDFRRILIRSTHEKMSFYAINTEHSNGVNMIDLVKARNVDFFGVKGEGDYTLMLIENSQNIRLFGYGGNSMPRAGWPLFNIKNSRDFLLANINPAFKPQGHAGRLGTAHNPRLWYLLIDKQKDVGGAVKLPGAVPVTLYKVGAP
ncbi:MAG: glycosyl hydrolase family 28-related protein [Candidatus Electrothrix communis]|nr:MAG: glycosyl hydrolase family 28-related protein [Candidatus Electrothrix communis]